MPATAGFPKRWFGWIRTGESGLSSGQHASVPVPLDSSKPYLSPGELQEVVEAVTRADANDESTWIEWKSTLDLGEGSAHHHIAKYVLGFADRPVQTAALHADGHAYLVVGAEPGSVAGVDPVGPAVLRSRILATSGRGLDGGPNSCRYRTGRSLSSSPIRPITGTPSIRYATHWAPTRRGAS
jgi:hypothetical protein